MADRFQPVRIAFLPGGPIDFASSRLRCYGLAQELSRIGYATQIGIAPGDAVDVLFVQKRIDEIILAAAKTVKNAGGLVIYDIDDYGDALAWFNVSEEVHSAFISQCDVICVDTDVRREVFAADPVYAGIPHKWIVPDPIDYIGSQEQAVSERGTSDRSGDGLVCCWFGNATNIVAAAPYLEAASKSPNVDSVEIISNKDYLGRLGEMFPRYRVEAWKLETFPQRLRQADFCLLVHDSNLEGAQKSNNKMLASLALGVIPFLSRTPAYENTALVMGLEALLLDSPDDLPLKLAPESMRAAKEAISGKQCQSELAKFMPARIASAFSAQLQLLLKQQAAIRRAAAKPLTIVTHHYNNEAGVKLQLAAWRAYPKEVLESLEFIVVDDCSDTQAHLDFTGLDIRLFRVDTDIAWNQAGCRNLGASEARTEWLLFCDIDHVIDRDNISRLLGGIGSLDLQCIYQFARREKDQAIHSTPNCFLVGRRAFLETNGYDEDFCGHYGFADAYWLERWRLIGRNSLQLTNVELRVDGVQTVGLDRDPSWNRRLIGEKLASSAGSSGARIRFSWREIDCPADAVLTNGQSENVLRLNLGSGEQPLAGYVNVDLAPERRGQQPDVNCDIRDLRGVFSDNYADEILAVHVVEHFWRWEVGDILKEWVRVLKPGGKLILECPNLISACEALLIDPMAGAMPDQRGNRTMWCFYGDPSWKDPLMCHRWLYTPQSLAQVMHEAGLGDLRQELAQFKLREPRDMRIVGTKPRTELHELSK